MSGLSPLAIEFHDATEDAINFGVLPDLYSDVMPKTISLACWIRPSAFGGVGVEKSILSFASETIGGGIRIYFNSTLPVFHSAIFALSGGYWLGPAYTASVLQHIVVTYDFSSTVNDPIFYKDGFLGASGEVIAPAGAENPRVGIPFVIGNRNDYGVGYNAPFEGNIFDVRVYSYILSSGEVLSIYNSGVPDMLAGPRIYNNATRVGLVFQSFAVKTSRLSEYVNTTLTDDLKVRDAVFGAIGLPVGSPVGKASV